MCATCLARQLHRPVGSMPSGSIRPCLGEHQYLNLVLRCLSHPFLHQPSHALLSFPFLHHPPHASLSFPFLHHPPHASLSSPFLHHPPHASFSCDPPCPSMPCHMTYHLCTAWPGVQPLVRHWVGEGVSSDQRRVIATSHHPLHLHPVCTSMAIHKHRPLHLHGRIRRATKSTSRAACPTLPMAARAVTSYCRWGPASTSISLQAQVWRPLMSVHQCSWHCAVFWRHPGGSSECSSSSSIQLVVRIVVGASRWQCGVF